MGALKILAVKTASLEGLVTKHALEHLWFRFVVLYCSNTLLT